MKYILPLLTLPLFLLSCTSNSASETDRLTIDLEKGGELIYDFFQIGEGVHTFDGESSNSKIKGRGELVLHPKSATEANIAMRNLDLTMTNIDPQGVPLDTIRVSDQMFVVEGLVNDGTFNLTSTSPDFAYRFLFVLPNKLLNIGESVTMPMQIPFNADGTVLLVGGDINISLEKEEDEAMHFQSTFSLSELDLPEDFDSDVLLEIKGSGSQVFDLTDQNFTYSEVDMSVKMYLKGKGNEEVPAGSIMTMAMQLDQTGRYAIQRRE